MPAAMCTSCGEIGEFRAKRGMRLSDQPCRSCGGRRTTTRRFRVDYCTTNEPKWLRCHLAFTFAEAQEAADHYRRSTMFGGYTVVGIFEKVASNDWRAVTAGVSA